MNEFGTAILFEENIISFPGMNPLEAVEIFLDYYRILDSGFQVLPMHKIITKTGSNSYGGVFWDKNEMKKNKA